MMEAVDNAVPSGGLVSSSLLYPAVLATGAILLVHLYQRTSRFYRLGNLLPGPKGFPLLGHFYLGFTKSPETLLQFALHQTEKYGNVVRLWLANYLVVGLMDPRDIELILGSQEHIDKAPDYQFFKNWLGDGLLISTGEKWRYHRKLIAPTFHLNVLKSFVGLFNKNSRETVKKMEKEIGREFDVHDYMSTATVDMLIETAMGIKKTHQDNAGFEYAVAVMKLCDIVHQRMFKIWLRLDAVFYMSSFGKRQRELIKIIHDLTTSVIRNKKIAYQNNKPTGVEEEYTIKDDIVEEKVLEHKGPFLKDDLDDDNVGEKKRSAFLNLMLEQQHETKLTDQEIKEQVDTIMFEGHDTTAAGSSFFLCMLGLYHDIQDKVYAELEDIFGQSDRPATFADTVNMKYLERVIMESLRLYPPVPIIARQIKTDLVLASSGQVVPANSTVVIGTLKLHRSKAIYGPNADVFDPDNFLPEKMANRHYYGYVPFSAGPRSCVGRKYAMLKLKILLSTILREYKINASIPEKDFRLIGDIILKRKDGFMISIEKRQKNLIKT